uniref:Uncharacterized protein n=1 Tax=Echinococcus granulosus TaxID=6210 RepID=A0A068WRM5_ECHGR|nr:hypothetical protein EgrG_000153100 [Echinococcus granulosus]
MRSKYKAVEMVSGVFESVRLWFFGVGIVGFVTIKESCESFGGTISKPVFFNC